MKGCMIAGASSGSGKTSVTMGILAALKAKGFAAEPFKCGPDYIDTGYHARIAGRDCVNLDTYLCPEETVRYLYAHYAEGADFGIVEGVMGLYDGLGATDIRHSSAHIAKTLRLPVILVIDGSGVSMSAAAMVKGFAAFDRKVKIAGVIVNRVSCEGHFQLLKRIIEEKTKIPCVGYLPHDPELTLPERHLGLVPALEAEKTDEVIKKLADAAGKHIDLALLTSLCAEAEAAAMPPAVQDFLARRGGAFSGKKIAVARDEAFHFYYRPNLDLLRLMGAELVFFSPLKDAAPPEADAFYIGGGFPEVFAAELSGNVSFRNALKERLQGGLPCYAECGGLMYLCENIAVNGKTHAMAGFLPADAVMTDALQDFGYLKLKLRSGLAIPAHEFHYAKLTGKSAIKSAYTVVKNKKRHPGGVKKKNTVAGFPHIHFWGNLETVPELFGLKKL